MIRRLQIILTAHIARRAYSRIDTTKSWAYISFRAGCALGDSHHRAESSRWTRYGIPVTITRTVGSSRTCDLISERAIKSRWTLPGTRWFRTPFWTVHALIAWLWSRKVFRIKLVNTHARMTVHSCWARNRPSQFETRGAVVKEIVGRRIVIFICKVKASIVQAKTPT